MHQQGRFFHAEEEDVQVVRLPYRHDRFSLLVVLPREPLPMATFQEISHPMTIARLTGALREQEGTVGLPRVRLGYSVDLKTELVEMGMAPAFAADADFSRIFGDAFPAQISQVLHKARLEIDEEGTTASASTQMVVSMSEPIAPPPETPFEMIVDRPFLAVLSDRLTEEILFIGVIGDPTPGDR